MGGVCRDVATFVVTVQSKVQTEQVLEFDVLLAALAEHSSEVVRPILVQVDLSWKGTPATVGILVDLCGNGWQLSEQADAVFVSWLPVLGLVETLLVCLGEDGGVVQGGHSAGELSHWVQVLREVVEEGVDVVWESSFLGKLAREDTGLGGGWDLASQEQPEHGLWQHLSTGGTLWQLILAVLDGLAVEADTLIGVEDGAFPDHGGEASVIIC